jgi:hypothetical protein
MESGGGSETSISFSWVVGVTVVGVLLDPKNDIFRHRDVSRYNRVRIAVLSTVAGRKDLTEFVHVHCFTSFKVT